MLLLRSSLELLFFCAKDPVCASRLSLQKFEYLMRTIFLFLALFALVFSACQKNPTQTASAGAKRYAFKGKVVSVDRANRKAKIDHEAVEDYMPAMEMDFPIHEDWVWDDLVPGSEIRAELVVDNSAEHPYWLEKIGIIAIAKPGQPAPPVPDERFA